MAKKAKITPIHAAPVPAHETEAQWAARMRLLVRQEAERRLKDCKDTAFALTAKLIMDMVKTAPTPKVDAVKVEFNPLGESEETA